VTLDTDETTPLQVADRVVRWYRDQAERVGMS
jgi:hypothetical protein